MLISLSSEKEIKRVGKEAFLKKSKAAKKRYLERYPKSKHRFLDAEGNVSKKKKKRNPLTKDEYEALTPRGKTLYAKQFPKSKHSARIKKARKTKNPDTSVDFKQTRKEFVKVKSTKRKEAREQRNVMHSEGTGIITREQVRALNQVESKHLVLASSNLQSNRGEIKDLVHSQLDQFPEFKARGLQAVRNIMHGHEEREINPNYKELPDSEPDDGIEDAEFEDIEDTQGEPDKEQTPKKPNRLFNNTHDQKDAMAMVGTVIKYGLIGVGVGLLALSAGPLSMIIGRALLEMSSDAKDASDFLLKAGRDDDAEDDFDDDEVAFVQKPKGKHKRKPKRQRATASNNDQDDTTIDNILDFASEYLKHVDIRDIKATSAEVFTSLSSTKSIEQELQAIADSYNGNYEELVDSFGDLLYSKQLVDKVRVRKDTVLFECNGSDGVTGVGLTKYPDNRVRFDIMGVGLTTYPNNKSRVNDNRNSQQAPDPSDERSHTLAIKNAPREKSISEI